MTRWFVFLVGFAACSPAAAPAGSVPPPQGAPPSVERAACHHEPPGLCSQPAPSFAGEVEPILKRRCLGCHAGNGVAAEEHDFSRLEGVVAERSAIVEEIASCSMPPRSPIGDAEAATLLRWATCAQANRQHADDSGAR